MTAPLVDDLNAQSVVRHYRAATRSDVEDAYRAESGRAAAAGYLPVAHNWWHDANGYLLAVTYMRSSPADPVAELATPAEPTQAGERQQPPMMPSVPQPVTIRESSEPPSLIMVSPTVDEFAPTAESRQPDSFAPAAASDREAETNWVSPDPAEPDESVQRYTPPPETYREPADLYVSARPRDHGTASPAPSFEQPAEPDQPAALTETRERQASAELAVPTPPRVPEVVPTPAPAEEHDAARRARLTVQTMDLHAAGEPLRIIRSGFPDVPHLPVLERRRWIQENADHVRRALMHEPRGHRDMYGAILLPPYNDYADMTVLFMHNDGYSTMCGHGVIAITTGLIEEGLYPATEPVTTIRYEVPAGIVAANAATVKLDDGSWAVRGVRFTNVPSYLAAQSLAVRPDGVALHGAAAQYGALGVDLAFGGAYYGVVNAAELGLRVVPEQADALRRAGAAITDVLRRDHTPSHPTEAALGFVYGTIIVDLDPRSSPDGKGARAHMRNVTIFADAELDRSPCGSGTSAILAQLHARGRIKVGQEIVNAGITGEHFLGRIEAETQLGPYAAVSTSIAGTAYVTGYSTFIVDSRDPLGDGFLLG